MIGVDTNVILNILRENESSGDREGSFIFFKFCQKKRLDVVVSVITLTELFRKPFRSKSVEEKKKVDSFLHFIDAESVPITNDSAIEAARLIEELNIDFADALIAASLDFTGIKTFVTRNTQDYKRTNLEILTPEEFVKKYS